MKFSAATVAAIFAALAQAQQTPVVDSTAVDAATSAQAAASSVFNSVGAGLSSAQASIHSDAETQLQTDTASSPAATSGATSSGAASSGATTKGASTKGASTITTEVKSTKSVDASNSAKTTDSAASTGDSSATGTFDSGSSATDSVQSASSDGAGPMPTAQIAFGALFGGVAVLANL